MIEPDTLICPKCGQELVVAADNVRYLIEVEPQKIKVIKIIKRNMKCHSCNKEDGRLYYPLSNEVFGNSFMTPSFAA